MATPPAPAMTGLAMLEATLEAEKHKPTPASTGCPAVDESALEGGFRYGEITSIAGSSGVGKTLVFFLVQGFCAGGGTNPMP